MKKVQSLRNAVMVSLLAGTTLVWGGTAFAQEDLQEFALEDMVVTAAVFRHRRLIHLLISA